MGERLTEAQRRWLTVLANDPVGSLGVPIGLMELADEKFCELFEADLIALRRSSQDGISATITPAGRSLLKENPNG